MVPLLLALSLTQILGWSTTFYIPATLGEAAMADTGLSRPVVFGGVTIIQLNTDSTLSTVEGEIEVSGTIGFQSGWFYL